MQAFKDRVIATVSTGYNSTATTIVLNSGDGSKIPTPPCRLTWWQSTNNTNPNTDGNVEEVLCTAISSDTLTIVRGISVAASNKNTSLKAYSIASFPTAQFMANDLTGDIIDKGPCGGLTFAGGSTPQLDCNIGSSLGTLPCALWFRGFLRTVWSNQEMDLIALSSSTGTVTTLGNAFLVYADNNGSLLVKLTGTTSSDYLLATILNWVPRFTGKTFDVLASRTGGVLKIYINGISEAYTQTSAGTPPADWSGSITSNYLNVGYHNNLVNKAFDGSILEAIPFNRSFSDAEALSLTTLGLTYEDKYGKFTADYTSIFTSTDDGWTGSAMTPVSNQTVAAVTGAEKFWADGSAGQHVMQKSGFAGRKRYRVTFDYYIPSANTTLKAFNVSFFAVNLYNISGTVTPTLDAWTTYSVEGLAVTGISSATLRLVMLNAAGAASWTGANSSSNDLFYLKNMTVTETGALIEPDFEVGIGYEIPDRSTILAHGVSTVSDHREPTRRGQVRWKTNTSGNQQLLGAPSILTNARIMYCVAKPETGTPTITLGVTSGTAGIVASVALSSGRNDLTLLLRYSSTSSIWANSNSTDVIDWTIGYELID